MTHHHEFDAGYLNRLQQFDRVLEPMHHDMLAWLAIALGSRALDAGCGGGGMTKLLAETVGNSGQVTALDIEPALLEATQTLLAGKPYVDSVSYELGSIDNLAFTDGTFDVVWCSRVIHHMRDMLAAVREIRRVLKPGGTFAMREDGFLMQLIPFDIGLGEPGLETRLNVARAWEFAQVRPSIEDAVPYPFGWTQLLRDAGFSSVAARSFMFEGIPPFDDDLSDFVVRHWRRPLETEETRAQLTPEDQEVLEKLVEPQSEHYLLRRNDLHYVKVSSVFTGRA